MHIISLSLLILVTNCQHSKLLKELDDVRQGGSWRDEDPDVGPIPAGKEDPVQKAHDDIKYKASTNGSRQAVLVTGDKVTTLSVDRAFDMQIGIVSERVSLIAANINL